MTPKDARPVRLERDEVHLWWRRMGETELPPSSRTWLSDDERRRLERFQRANDARTYLEKRVFQRSILAAYLGCEPAALEIEPGDDGKPVLVGPFTDLSFNLSRSGDWLLLGLAYGRAVGVDVERVDRWLRDEEELSRLAARVLTPLERNCLEQLGRDARPAALVRAWARKEAVLKALGTGLAREPSTVEVGVHPLGPLEVVDLDAEVFPRSSGARMIDVAAPAGFAASLVAEGRNWDLMICSRAA